MKIAITDPISSASLLARRAKEAGHSIVELRTFDPTSEYYTRGYDPSLFDRTVEYTGDDAAALHELRDVSVILTGADSGVATTDRLRLYRGELRSDPSLILARADKVEQARRVQEAGFDVVPQQYFTSEEAEMAVRFARSRGFPDLPIVLKPRASGGTNNVRLVRDEREFREAFSRISAAKSLYERTNGGCIVMDFVDPNSAVEFVVDAVSSRGQHLVTDVWKYEKEPLNGTPAMYRAMSVVPFADAAPLVDYTLQLVNALGHREGAVHAEVWSTPDGFRLVEIGFRLPGLITNISAAATGRDQVGLTLDATLNPDRFVSEARRLESSRACNAASVVFMAAGADGVINRAVPDGVIRALESFHSFTMKAQAPGDRYVRTVDVGTMVGWVALTHADPARVARDISALREIEMAFGARRCWSS